MFKMIHIKKHERGLWFRRGDFERLLYPGTYRFWERPWNFGSTKVETVDLLKARFEHPMLDVLIDDERLRESLIVVDLTDDERALVWKNGRLLHILGPGRHAYWKLPHALTVETFDVKSFRLEHRKLQAILQHPDALRWLDGVATGDNEDVLLYRDGVLIDTLAKGLHVFWKGTGKVTWKAVDRREQTADVAGQEIMTSDKLTLRVNLLVTYQVADTVKAVTAVADYAQALYREAQLVLRAAIGTRTLDTLLGDKEAIGGEVRVALAQRAAELGVRVQSVGLRDIILPGDMKLLLNGVIAATKEAEANLIRRREETAAARSQANTAKLLAESPQLARLKELEMLQSILAGSKATFVFGAGDIAEQVRTLVTASPSDG
jgi:regulator of protease activity HflC (stomatin/prohibitin superfamily)